MPDRVGHDGEWVAAGAEEAGCCCGAGSCAETELCGGHVQGAVTRSGMTSIVRRRYEPHGS